MSSVPPTKVCTKCGETKPLDDFHKSKTGTFERHAYCKVCLKAWTAARKGDPAVQERSRAWRDAYYSRPDVIERVRRYDAEHREQAARRVKVYCQRHPERIVAANKRQYEKNQAQRCAEARAWRENNPEEARERDARSRAKNGEKRRAAYRAWYAANPEKVRAAKRASRQRYPEKHAEHEARRRALKQGTPAVEKIDRVAIIARDNSTCYLCERVLSRNEITLDHYIPLSAGGPHTAANLRVACRSCNSRKWTHLPPDLQGGL